MCDALVRFDFNLISTIRLITSELRFLEQYSVANINVAKAVAIYCPKVSIEIEFLKIQEN